MEPMTKTSHRLGWCDPGQARFWHRDEPSHRCPEELGTIMCSCPCHRGIAPDQVNQDDREEREALEAELARGKMEVLVPKTKKKRRRVVRKKP